jgi:hypothetical protein
VVEMARWHYFEDIGSLMKWLKEVIELHERWSEHDIARKYRYALKLAKRFEGFLYSSKCFGYLLMICSHVNIVALCRDGDTIKPVDVEEWLEYADL